MRAVIGLLFGLTMVMSAWLALVIVHDYGQMKYQKGYSEAMANCSAGRKQ
jgi:hypothetical protein